MFFLIQELTRKRENKNAYAKRLETGVKIIDGMPVNFFEFSKEKFSRTIKKSYRIVLQENFRDKDKVKKHQQAVTTLHYYDIAVLPFDSYDETANDILSNLWDAIFKAADKMSPFLSKYCNGDDYTDYMIDLFTKKTDSLFQGIQEEFAKTEEYKTHKEHLKILQKYKESKRQFKKDYIATDLEYDICYDVYGNLTNPSYLKHIQQARACRYQEEKYSSYTDEEKKILKRFYVTLAKRYHPDANPYSDTTPYMQLLVKLKEEWDI